MITGYEVKCRRSDFTRDDKWIRYLGFCNRFYLACPAGMIKTGELPDGIGLITYHPEKRSLYTARAASIRTVEPDSQLLYYIIMNKLESDRHPFFNDKLAYAQAYLANHEESLYIGSSLGTKMSRELDERQTEITQLKRFIRDWSKDQAILMNLAERIAKKLGVPDLPTGSVQAHRILWVERITASLESLDNGVYDHINLRDLRRIRASLRTLEAECGRVLEKAETCDF